MNRNHLHTCAHLSIPVAVVLLGIVFFALMFGCSFDEPSTWDETTTHKAESNDDCKRPVDLPAGKFWCGGVKGYAVTTDGGVD